jgi:hypothetical protein
VVSALRALLERFTGSGKVALISYPKSGRTWVRFMLNAAGVEVTYDHAGAENRDARRFDQIAGIPKRWSQWRIAFLFRDPRDTAVSSFFQASKRVKQGRRFTGDIHQFIRDPRYGIEKIARFNLLWMQSAPLFEDFMSVSYEALHANTEAELSRLVAFATRETPDPAVIARAVEEGRFDRMRAAELNLGARKDGQARLGGGDPADPESLKARRGKVGGWTDYFSADDSAYADSVLARLDYDERMASLHRAS